MKTIPKVIDYVTPSEEAICLHEAGHACAALVVGLAPTLMELVSDPESPGLARNSIPRGDQQQRRLIACAAFAVEYSLYSAGRLADAAGAPVDEKTFIRIGVGHNAAIDKTSFFDANRADKNGVWSKEDDEAFIAKGCQLSGVLPMSLIFELAEALLNERSLECERITEIGARHLPGSAHEWKCP
jgi:hypothetical protein